MSGGSGGASAELISNASFATLMVIYSFTQLMDMADELSELAGLTTRVAQLMEVRSTHALLYSRDSRDLAEAPPYYVALTGAGSPCYRPQGQRRC